MRRRSSPLVVSRLTLVGWCACWRMVAAAAAGWMDGLLVARSLVLVLPRIGGARRRQRFDSLWVAREPPDLELLHFGFPFQPGKDLPQGHFSHLMHELIKFNHVGFHFSDFTCGTL